MKKLAAWAIISIAILVPGFSSYSQTLPITYIEVFGNRQVSADIVVQKAGIHEGDTIAMFDFGKEHVISSIKSLSAVKGATVEPICCEDRSGGLLIFIGISESDKVSFKYHKNPVGSVILPKEMTQTYHEFNDAVQKAVLSGNATEDYSNGYSLLNDSASRTLQKKFIGYANNKLALLQKVIRESSDPYQRETAAWIIAYNDYKKKFIPDLLYAVSDSSEDVRNNATRSLGILAGYAQMHPELKIEIPVTPFIEMIHSSVWTDRNKGSFVLEGLTQSRKKELLISLKKNSLPELIEMAKWRSKGHAYAAFFILARIAGIKEAEINKLFEDQINSVDMLVQKINRAI